MAAEKEGGIVKKGHEEGLKLAVSLLKKFELPEGLLPLANVVEVGYVESTGYMWIVQQNKVEHEFKMISKLVSYDTEINGYVDKMKIKKLRGVKAKELMLWPPVSEIRVDDPPTGKIHFKSLAGITKTFPVEAFAAGQWFEFGFLIATISNLVGCARECETLCVHVHALFLDHDEAPFCIFRACLFSRLNFLSRLKWE